MPRPYLLQWGEKQVRVRKGLGREAASSLLSMESEGDDARSWWRKGCRRDIKSLALWEW